MPDQPAPPVAARRPHPLVAHGHERNDEWFWLSDRENPEVIAYLEAENAYTKAVTAHTEPLQEQLFEEIRSRIQETDASAPVVDGDWWYFSRTVEGLQYPIHCRRPIGSDAEGDHVQVLLDENVLAEGHDFFSLGGFETSPDHRLLAYATDTTGGERHTLRFRDLEAGADFEDVVEDVYYGLAWANDNRTVFYSRPDKAMRPYQVWRHTLGTPAHDDVLVFQEDDERFFAGVERTRSGQLIFVEVRSKVTTETRFIPADDPTAEATVIHPREQDLEYYVDHSGDRFFIVTNADGALNAKLVEAPVDSPGRASWREVVPHRPEVKLEGITALARHLILSERERGLQRLVVRSIADGSSHAVEQPEPVFTVSAGDNHVFDTDVIRFYYTSMVTPMSAIDYDVTTRSRTVVKQTPVLGGFDAAQYTTDRIWATAPDGVEVPISILHRRDTPLDGSAPALLYGYGSYEISIPPTFSSVRLSLVDRGFVFAIAHIRGGGDLGRPWYDGGKLLNKRNTFTDFIAAAEHLIDQGYTSPDRLACRGGSAGGLLIGAVVNMRPDLFRAAVAEVPFVDCLTTILDASLPLTVIEWEEWGNPVESPDVYEYMRSYTPYENVEPKEYPALLVTAGLNDPRVSYWEPAKWVAKLRATKKGDQPLLLKTEMGAGHQGPSGRYDAWKDEAFVYAFLLDNLPTP